MYTQNAESKNRQVQIHNTSQTKFGIAKLKLCSAKRIIRLREKICRMAAPSVAKQNFACALLNSSLSTRRYVITGSQRASNYFWASVISLGGLSFLLTGFAAFLNRNFFLFNQSKNIAFFPQGLIMCFYGSLGLLFGIYLWCTIFWGVGNGFNEFNKEKGLIRIFRWGLPGKNRRIDLVYQMETVEGVRVELKEGVNPRRTISLKLKTDRVNVQNSGALLANSAKKKQVATITKRTTVKDRKNASPLNTHIPLTRIGQVIALEDIESSASELAQFLQVPLDSFYEL